ncbi:MAG: hypothetical protein JNL82_05640 [Myxococcales bacterium]|nr:hypothetical protein [Myxococcales bacterium]
MRLRGVVVCALALAGAGCDGDDGVRGDDARGTTPIDVDEFRFAPGVNGLQCTASPYNCKLRPTGGNRVVTADADDNNAWAIAQGVPVLDGHGSTVAFNAMPRTFFVYGQSRVLKGAEHVFAALTTNGGAGWLRRADIADEASFAAGLGSAPALGEGLAELGCYRIVNTHDADLEYKRVIYDSRASHERAADYLPLPRANGQRSVDLLFNVPAYTLGGVAIDHFPAGTKFRRLDVPTGKDDAGPPSLAIPLWVQDPQQRYRQQSGTMTFVYGYVQAADGDRRHGWIASAALTADEGCP